MQSGMTQTNASPEFPGRFNVMIALLAAVLSITESHVSGGNLTPQQTHQESSSCLTLKTPCTALAATAAVLFGSLH